MKKIKKIYIIAVGVLIFGIAAGAVWTFQGREVPASNPASEVLGETKEKTIPADNHSSDSSGVATPDNLASAQEGKESTKPPAPAPKPKPAVKKVDPCVQAAVDLEAKKTAAKKLFDQEQADIEREFQGLARKRTEAINSYLTAIALATAKYNSATSTDAYTVYKDEQGKAQTNYAEASVGISVQEAAIAESKKISQQKYDDALAEILSC